MSEYKIKKQQILVSYVIFGGITIFCFAYFILSKKNIFLFLSLVSMALMFLFVLLSKSTIIITDKEIKKRSFNGTQECAWDMIYSVRTVRMVSSGNYSTVLKWAREPQFRNNIIDIKEVSEKNSKSGVIDISDHYEGYIKILKLVKIKAVNAEIDHMTEKIIAEAK